MKTLDWQYKGKLGDMWSSWSHAAAIAEQHATGTGNEVSAWERSEVLWAEYQAALADYEATMDAAANRGGY